MQKIKTPTKKNTFECIDLDNSMCSNKRAGRNDRHVEITQIRQKQHKDIMSSGNGSPDLDPKWVRLALNGTNPGLFRSDVSTFWRSTF